MLVLAAAMVPPLEARAAESDTMSVTGQITAQTGCTISLSGGGAVDYGLITAASLNQSSDTYLPDKRVSANIVCAAPTYMAMTIGDVRGNTLSEGHGRHFGLGSTRAGIPIGYYRVQTQADEIPRPIVDGVSRRFGQRYGMHTEHDGWSLPGGTDTWPKTDSRTFIDNSRVAVPVSTAQFEIAVWGQVQSRNALQLVGAERIEGQFVLDIYYM
jgi:hypothetical protein